MGILNIQFGEIQLHFITVLVETLGHFLVYGPRIPLLLRSLFFPVGQFCESRKASGLLILLVSALGFF